MRWRAAGALIAGLLTAVPASAHSSFAGLNDFYSGVLHPAVVPAHALAILSVGLYLGQRRLAAGLERVLFANGAALAAGAMLAAFSFGAELDDFLLAITFGVGMLAVLDRGLPRYLLLLLAAAVGAAVGLGSASDANDAFMRLVSALGTTFGGLFLLIVGIALNGFFLDKQWQPIAIRVLGSWAAASALLVLALGIFGPTTASVAP